MSTTAMRRSGLVVPRTLPWHGRLLARLIYLLIRLVALTLRARWDVAPGFDALQTPAIFAGWHNRLALGVILLERMQRRRAQPRPMAAIVSASRDGAIVARILECFGVHPVRGSSSRRGPQALLELTTWAGRGFALAITPDGPRGPACVMQEGALALAQITGLPLVPATYELGWKIRVRSWDRFQVPLPFTRCVFKLGEPMRVPREATDEERERLRAEFEARLRQLGGD
jgi:lysophospholipid acyltransferase (LPLAT)-like uncharacterized protein